jgi:hypothetical protein
MKRRSVLFLAVLFMVAGLFLCLWKASRSDSITSDAAVETPSAHGGRISAESKGAAGPTRPGWKSDGKSWRHAEEKTEPGEPERSGDFPVYLGYLQSDGTNHELRIGLRQEAGAGLDVADLEIQANLLDAGGNLFGPETKIKSEWIVEHGDFSESKAPAMRVSSSQRVDGVDLILRYKGEEVERRRYVLAAPVPEVSPEQGGGSD